MGPDVFVRACPEYLAPGVSIEELDSSARTIAGVSTSTAAFVGETERGPTRPTLVTSFAEYTRRYGGFTDRPPRDRQHPYLPYAVRGFFGNGGERLVIARVTGRTAATAALTLSGEAGSLVLRAVGAGAWGTISALPLCRVPMTQDDIDNGRVICEVGVAMMKPAEFVVLRFHLNANGAS